MRADAWLHHVRLFKTRTMATQACTRGHVLLLGGTIKPARELKVGDLLDIERGDLQMVVRVLDFPIKRIGPPAVAQFMENLTPPENFIRAAEARRLKVMIAPHELAAKPDKKQLRLIRAWLGKE